MEMNPYQTRMLLDEIEQSAQPPDGTAPDDIAHLLHRGWIDSDDTLLTPDLVERIQTYKLTSEGESKLRDLQDSLLGQRSWTTKV